MLVDKYRYVVVEGPIGVGKTSLTHRLAEHCGATAMLEKPEENPFLTHFYQDPDGIEIELYVDADPAVWRENPAALTTLKPLKL